MVLNYSLWTENARKKTKDTILLRILFSMLYMELNYFSPKADAEKNKKHFYLNF